MASRDGPSLSKPRTCLCSPTTHPGSFRCSFHKNLKKPMARPVAWTPFNTKSNHYHWQASMAAKANSLRVMKAILLQIIKPSSHDVQRRKNFQARSTRFCLMNANRDAVAVS